MPRKVTKRNMKKRSSKKYTRRQTKGQNTKGQITRGNQEGGSAVGGLGAVMVGGMTFMTVYPFAVLWGIQKMFGAGFPKKIKKDDDEDKECMEFTKHFKTAKKYLATKAVGKSGYGVLVDEINELKKELKIDGLLGGHNLKSMVTTSTAGKGGAKIATNDAIDATNDDIVATNSIINDTSLDADLKLGDSYCLMPTFKKLDKKKITQKIKDRFNKISHILEKCKNALEYSHLCYLKKTRKAGGNKIPKKLRELIGVWEESRKSNKGQKYDTTYELWFRRFRNRAIDFIAIVNSVGDGESLIKKMLVPFSFDAWNDTAIAAINRKGKFEFPLLVKNTYYFFREEIPTKSTPRGAIPGRPEVNIKFEYYKENENCLWNDGDKILNVEINKRVIKEKEQGHLIGHGDEEEHEKRVCLGFQPPNEITRDTYLDFVANNCAGRTSSTVQKNRTATSKITTTVDKKEGESRSGIGSNIDELPPQPAPPPAYSPAYSPTLNDGRPTAPPGGPSAPPGEAGGGAGGDNSLPSYDDWIQSQSQKKK